VGGGGGGQWWWAAGDEVDFVDGVDVVDKVA
jgi:hypothetical protein